MSAGEPYQSLTCAGSQPALALSLRWSLDVWLCMQGCGAVSPAMGLSALCAALTGRQAHAAVVVNPFQWEVFLSGGVLTRQSETAPVWSTGKALLMPWTPRLRVHWAPDNPVRRHVVSVDV